MKSRRSCNTKVFSQFSAALPQAASQNPIGDCNLQIRCFCNYLSLAGPRTLLLLQQPVDFTQTSTSRTARAGARLQSRAALRHQDRWRSGSEADRMRTGHQKGAHNASIDRQGLAVNILHNARRPQLNGKTKHCMHSKQPQESMASLPLCGSWGCGLHKTQSVVSRSLRDVSGHKRNTKPWKAVICRENRCRYLQAYLPPQNSRCPRMPPLLFQCFSYPQQLLQAGHGAPPFCK